MGTLSEENYLKALFYLTNEKNQVSVNELSLFLHIKMPSVNSMMKKFSVKNWVNYESYKPLTLTREGKKMAAQVVRKHRLTEMFLVEKMNFGWEEVHEIAEQIEHIQSEVFFDKIDEILNFPKTDPHGSPIPDKKGKIIFQEYKKLSSFSLGDEVVLKALSDSSQNLLNSLNEKKLSLGTSIKIMNIDACDRTFEVKYLEKNEFLSPVVTEKLLVEKISS
ncbi:MAG: metal-dependent transcriptional regulator [Bergeyella sp.]|nr:metal-dependent transcriptional regulator [Bergeyella sp.]